MASKIRSRLKRIAETQGLVFNDSDDLAGTNHTERVRGACYWCGEEMNVEGIKYSQATVDHLVDAHSPGGRDENSMMVIACWGCNQTRNLFRTNGYLEDDWLERYRSMPESRDTWGKLVPRDRFVEGYISTGFDFKELTTRTISINKFYPKTKPKVKARKKRRAGYEFNTRQYGKLRSSDQAKEKISKIRELEASTWDET